MMNKHILQPYLSLFDSRKGRMNKRGYYYSLDAFIALMIILGVILFIRSPFSQTTYESKIQEDILLVLSNLKIGEINDTDIEALISGGEIKNLDQSVLEQIGEFYANSSFRANELTQNILDKLNLRENIGIYFNNNQIANSGSLSLSDAKTISTSRQIISGIHNGTAAKGFSSRAFLFAENKVDYFYFGGYIGDGNISAQLDGKVIGAKIEGVFSRNFDFYINEQFVSYHNPDANVPYAFDLSQNLSYFGDGTNNISFKSEENIYIAGGYLKIVYNETPSSTSINKKYFPGIDGLINIYDGFYIPGQLEAMSVSLHYNSSYDVFMTIGDTEVYKGNSSGFETTITINNVSLAGLFNYDDLSNKTIPYRLGLYNVSYVVNITQDADVFSVTDLSGSMASTCVGASGWCCFWNDCDDQTTCEATCGGTFEDKIGSAKDANKVFIDAILESSGNRIGLVGYETSARDSDFHELSIDNSSLNNIIDNQWDANGGTCICCGINKAVDELVANSSSDKYRSIVVMSDGQPTYYCNSFHDYDGSGTRGDWSGSTSDPLDIQWAIDAACNAYYNYGIIVHAVAFGSNADQNTLQEIGVNCGHGGFHQGDVEDLIGIYQEIAEDIINASYYEQTIVAEDIFTKLYPDSYIEIDYDREPPPGMLITSETTRFGNNISQGSFFIPDDSEVYEVQVISYSGSKWTSLVEINGTGSWNTVFNLSEYNSNFVELGDPYAVNIPPNLVRYGNNTVRVGLGLNPSEPLVGSEYNKAIYSIVKNISGYSPILASAEGCAWHIEFEDGTVEQIDVPGGYSGADNCHYNSTIPDSSHTHLANNNDAVEYAIYLLLSSLDLNDNGKIETKFTEQDLSITSTEIEGIPFTWETEVQARVWV